MKLTHDRDLILDAWARGESSSKIADRVGSSPGYVRTIVKVARENGDARALSRGQPGVSYRSSPSLDHDAILDRWSWGWATSEIARFAGTTPKTIYGMLINYRRRGDRRAVLRKTRHQ